MKLLPAGRTNLIEYMTAHLPIWQSDPEAVGLTQSQVEELAVALAEADAAFLHAKTLRSEAESATLASNIAIGGLRGKAATALACIKVFARTQSGEPEGQAGVYIAASIDPPLQAAPLPAPAQLGEIDATVNTRGQPTLEWKAPHPRDARERAASSSGLIYTVVRKLPGEREYSIVHTGKLRRFTDVALPAGQTLYMVRASRGEQYGEWRQAGAIQIGGETAGNTPYMQLAA